MAEMQTASRESRPAPAPGPSGAPEPADNGLAIQLGWRARWWPLAAALLPGIAFSLAYVQRTYVDVILLDGFIHVPYIGAALARGGSIGDLVQAPFAGEHLLVGYRLFLFANAKLFGLDMRLDPVMFVVASVATAAILYAEIIRSCDRMRPALFFLAFLPLGFLSFSFVAPPLLLMSTQFVWGTVVALLIAFLVQRDLDPVQHRGPLTRRALALALALIPLYFVVSGAYFPGLAFGLLGMFVFRRLLEGTRWLERRVVLIASVLLPCAAVYTYFMSHYTRPSSASGGMMTFITDLRGTLLSYVAGIAAALLDSHTLEKMSSPGVLSVGIAGTLLVIVSLWIFVKSEMYRRTYLPVYCIFYSVGIVTAVRTGRTAGWRWISAEWYAFHLRFFVIGVAWIFIYACIDSLRKRKAAGATFAFRGSGTIALTLIAAVFMGACQVRGNVAQWKRAPDVKEYYRQKRMALLYPQLFDDPSGILLWPADQIEQARTTLRKNSLSSYSQRSRDEVTRSFRHQTVRGSDWYGDDWVGPHGRALLISSRSSPVRLNAQLPAFMARNRCEFRLNDEVIFTGDLIGGTTRTVSGRLRSDVNTVTVTCAEAASPASQRQGADGRPLSVRVTIERG